MKTRRALVLYGMVVATLALMLAWWVVFFVRQGGVLVERANRGLVAVHQPELGPEQATAVRQAAHQSLRMFLYEGSFLFAAFLAGVVLMLRAWRREILLSRQHRDFLSAVTHELRTPLSAARLAVQSLRLGRVPEEKRERYLKNAEADLARLSELVERVLESSRVSTSGPRLSLERLDLAEFSARAARLLLADHEPALELELATNGSVPVEADVKALETILRNLLANAAKYATAPEGGPHRVRLTVERQGREACLLVRDFGPGVAGNPAKLFDAFVRGDGPLEKSRPGVGLGLFLVAELVRALGGRVSARNASAGGSGFEVEVRLPLAPEANRAS